MLFRSRVAILMTPFASLPLDGVLRATGHTRYLFRVFFWRLLVTVPAVLFGMHSFGMVGAIAGHAVAESIMRVVMLDKVRRVFAASWSEILPWGQLSVVGAASLVACAPAVLIARQASSGPRPFLALCAAGATYLVVYLGAIALTPGEGGALMKIRRVLLGHQVAAA